MIICEGNLNSEIFVDSKIKLIGYVLPRLGFSTSLKNKELLNELYGQYGMGFIQYVKGVFIIYIQDDHGDIHVFTDRVGIKKIYYWKKDDDFILSDSIDEIIHKVQPKISSVNMALHSLFHHFVDGRTMYENVYYSKPGSHFIISKDAGLQVEQYWNYEMLLNQPQKNVQYEDFAELLTDIVKSYSRLSSSKKYTMTLTGGMDSRIVLGTLLKNRIKPYAFTFGNEHSADVQCAVKIAKGFGIEYNNYNYPTPSANWYKQLSKQIIDIGHTMIHIHRSHRLDAIKREKEAHPEVDTIFLGAMGGEGIRGLHYDDLITTSFVRRHYEEGESIEQLVDEYLKKYYHKEDVIDKVELISIIKSLSFIKNSYDLNQFYLLYDLVASLHDTQDISLYNEFYKYVICPFLDVDYLELLFSSNFHLLNKKGTSRKIHDRLIIPAFHCNVSNLIYKPLGKYQFSNGFSPNEYLRGKFFYLGIRFIRKFFKKKFPPNFPYLEWYRDMVITELGTLQSSGSLSKIFDNKRALNAINNSKCDYKEGYWHKYSNIIMCGFYLNKFHQNK